MNGLPYYKAFPRDFLEGTIGMPFEMKGAYRIVLDLIYMNGGNLPDDPRYIAGQLGCSVRKWKTLRAALLDAGKLHVIGGCLTNYRAVIELETLRKLQDKQAENAREPKKNKDLRKPWLSHTEPESESDKKKKYNPLTPLKSEFAEFWAVVPRRVAKGAAERAFAKARKEADADVIISAMRRYAESRDGQDHQFTAHPATWLNQRRWEDELQNDSNRREPNGKRNAADIAKRVAARVDSGEDYDASQPLLSARTIGTGDGGGAGGLGEDAPPILQIRDFTRLR